MSGEGGDSEAFLQSLEISSIAVNSSDYEKQNMSICRYGVLYADCGKDSPDKVVEISPLSPPSV